MRIAKFIVGLALSCVSFSAVAQEKTVHVYNWSDYITPEAIAGFSKETGIKVVYDVYDSNETLEAKLLVGRSGYDVVFAAARPYALRQIQAKLVQPLDKAKLPNYRHLDAKLLKSLVDVDVQQQYAVPYMWGTTGIGINVGKVQAALGTKAALDSWQLILDPVISAKLKSCGISILDDEAEGLGAIMVALGKKPQSALDADLALAAKTITNVRSNMRYFHSSKYIGDLASGDLCVAMGYSGDIFQAKNRAIEAKNGVDIRYIIPKEGTVQWVDIMMIPKDAPNADYAHQFINYLMKPEVIAQISNVVGYANANATATPMVDANVRNDPAVYPNAATMARLVPNAVISQADKRKRVRVWTNIKAGRIQ